MGPPLFQAGPSSTPEPSPSTAVSMPWACRVPADTQAAEPSWVCSTAAIPPPRKMTSARRRCPGRLATFLHLSGSSTAQGARAGEAARCSRSARSWEPGSAALPLPWSCCCSSGSLCFGSSATERGRSVPQTHTNRQDQKFPRGAPLPCAIHLKRIGSEPVPRAEEILACGRHTWCLGPAQMFSPEPASTRHAGSWEGTAAVRLQGASPAR